MLPHIARRATHKRAAARTLRANATEAERKLWHCLRDKRLMGVRFRRQQPIGPYVADFYCSIAKLIVEVDGGQHADPAAAERDGERTRWLEQRGYSVVRFWNSDLSDSDYVIGAIVHALGGRLPAQMK
ncbi:MAG: endonuclease domain-containing protein [Alphaproteobacteria bacterium]